MKFIMVLTIFFSLVSCQANEDKKLIPDKDLVTKKYFVKGMTCGGCIFGVKAALSKLETIKIVDTKIEVGIAIIQFNKKNYKDSKTDCKITKVIEKATEFKVFLDEKHTLRACES